MYLVTFEKETVTKLHVTSDLHVTSYFSKVTTPTLSMLESQLYTS